MRGRCGPRVPSDRTEPHEQPAPPANDATNDPANESWWRFAVIYQVYIRCFADGDGDGTGDIAGPRSRLQYLAYLGVEAIWITPWYPSPLADLGYDVSDFRDIHPTYGTLDEARKLITEAHELGLRVILDIVPNHVSNQHAWFQEALAAAPGSPERHRFIFREGRGKNGSEPPNDWHAAFGGPTWIRTPDGQLYLHSLKDLPTTRTSKWHRSGGMRRLAAESTPSHTTAHDRRRPPRTERGSRSPDSPQRPQSASAAPGSELHELGTPGRLLRANHAA
ncbi:hypothetical protein ADK36_08515 [Streptomyces viridochromogenes]|nr:hypothetical protein ADK36_08515 [Streptomyces viridochromogenes]